MVLRIFSLIGLAVCLVLGLSGCPTDEGSSASRDAKKPGESDDHGHHWADQEKAAEASRASAKSTSPAGDDGLGEDGARGPAQDAVALTPEATIVHSELGPEELVRHYLMLGSAGDLSRIADYVDPRCYRGPVGRVDAVRLVGTLMTLDALTLASVFQTETKARVNYHLVGGVTAGGKKGEIGIGGEEVGERTAILTTTGIERRGSLDLALIDSLWRVTCTFSYAPSEDNSGASP